jgi:hypothetical protein
MIKDFEDLQTVGKENFEAATASATAMTKAFQDIAVEVADYQRKSFEDGTAVFEKALAAKSIDKALEVQTDFAKGAYEAYLGRVAKIGEIYLAAAKEACKPFEGTMAQFTGKTSTRKSA